MITSSFYLENEKKRSRYESKRDWAGFRKARSSWESGAQRAAMYAEPSMQAEAPAPRLQGNG